MLLPSGRFHDGGDRCAGRRSQHRNDARACFERASVLLGLGSTADCRAGFGALIDNDDFAGFLTDFDIEILHSGRDGVAVAPPKPRIGY